MPCLHTVLYMQVRPFKIPFELIYLQCQRINCHLVRSKDYLLTTNMPEQWSNLNILSGEATDIVRWGGEALYILDAIHCMT
jgi:hypothetical protein